MGKKYKLFKDVKAGDMCYVLYDTNIIPVKIESVSDYGFSIFMPHPYSDDEPDCQFINCSKPDEIVEYVYYDKFYEIYFSKETISFIYNERKNEAQSVLDNLAKLN